MVLFVAGETRLDPKRSEWLTSYKNVKAGVDKLRRMTFIVAFEGLLPKYLS